MLSISGGGIHQNGVFRRKNSLHIGDSMARSTQKKMGTSAASRRIGKNRSGRPSKVTQNVLNEMLNAAKNPVRDQPWLVQIDYFQLHCTRRTLQNACKRRTPKAGRYKMTKVKAISDKNKQLRVEYRLQHENETIYLFWQFVHYTEKAHLDPAECFSKRILREEGTRFEAKNMQPMPDMKGVKLHFAASIPWHHKGALQFYNDEHDPPPVITKKLPKPRKSRYQSEETYRQRIIQWEASLPHDPEVKPKGNSMT